MTTVGGGLRRAAERLEAAGCESPRVDAELLLAQVLTTSRAALYGESGRRLSAGELAAFGALVARRARREPVAYILGEWGFRRLSLRVDRRVLVPRPETEVVVERCLDRVLCIDAPLPVPTSRTCGAIALAIADEHPGARITGIDASADALAVARANAARLGLTIELERRDLFDGLPRGPWDLVVANPPYVSPAEIDALEPEVRDWEPRTALVADGATEAVARGALGVLGDRGALVLEVADRRAGEVASLLRDLGYREVETTRDLTGRPRVVEGVP